jgi:methyltransferase-like protein 6
MDEDGLKEDDQVSAQRREHTLSDPISISYYEMLAAMEYSFFGDSVMKEKSVTKQKPPKQMKDEQDDRERHPTPLPLWGPYVWTASDEERAEELLQKNWSKCRIPNDSEFQRNRFGRRSKKIFKNQWNNNNTNTASDSHVWDAFYQQHQTNFFKDRYYLSKSAFPQELAPSSERDDAWEGVLVEIGCGVGNAIWPILEQSYSTDDDKEEETTCPHPDGLSQTQKRRRRRRRWTVYGLDWSSVAIDTLQRDPRFVRAANEHRAFAAVCDVSQIDSIPMTFRNVGTVTSMIFCLSAISPDRHVLAVQNAIQTLRPGGVLIFRDYGRYDQAQLNLGQQHHKWISENFYRKHDGTKCYYFTVSEIRTLFVKGHLEELECDYIRRVFYNRKDNKQRRRVWIQARFRKPLIDESS